MMYFFFWNVTYIKMNITKKYTQRKVYKHETNFFYVSSKYKYSSFFEQTVIRI